jgi:hypothetical protein
MAQANAGQVFPDNYVSFNWPGYADMDEGHPQYYLPSALPEEVLILFHALTRKRIRAMTVLEMKAMYKDTGVDLTAFKKKKDLQNLLWTHAVQASIRLNEIEAELGVGPIHIEERKTIRQLTQEQATLKRKLGLVDSDVNMRPLKRPTLVAAAAKDRILLAEDLDADGTYIFTQPAKHPLRLLFFDQDAIGYARDSDPPGVKAVTEDLYIRNDDFHTPLTEKHVGLVAKLQLSQLDLRDFAHADMTAVTSDRKAMEMALANLCKVVKQIHGRAMATRMHEFLDEVRELTGPQWSLAIIIKYCALVFRLFTKSLQAVHDEYDSRAAGSDLTINIPHIGDKATDSHSRRTLDKALTKWRYNQALGRDLDNDLPVDGVMFRPGTVPPKEAGDHGRTPRAGLIGKIIASRIPEDTKGKRFCIQYGRKVNPCNKMDCKFSHDKVLSEAWNDYVRGKTDVKPHSV